MKRLLINIVLLSVLISCSDSIPDILSKKEYWFYDNFENIDPCFFSFSKDGKLKLTEFYKDSVFQDFCHSKCVRWNHSWKMINDSTIYVGFHNETFRVFQINDSLIRLKNKERTIDLRPIDNITEYTCEVKKARQLIKKIVSNTQYELKINKYEIKNNIGYIHGTSTNGDAVVLTFPRSQFDVIAPRQDWVLSKQKGSYYINMFNTDSVSSYRYMFYPKSTILVRSKFANKKQFIYKQDGVYYF